jgi:hypothetical protein
VLGSVLYIAAHPDDENTRLLAYLANDQGAAGGRGYDLVPGRAKIGKLVEVIRKFDAGNPSASVEGLVKVRGLINNPGLRTSDYSSSRYYMEKLQEVDELIKACLGLQFEVTSDDASIVADTGVTFNYEVIKRSSYPVKFLGVRMIDGFSHSPRSKGIDLQNGQKHVGKMPPGDYAISQPYWLRNAGSIGMYSVAEQTLRGNPENDSCPLKMKAGYSIQVGDKRSGESVTEALRQLGYTVTLLDSATDLTLPKHPLLNTPNKLTPEDFSTGWVQEQGLYYPSAWDAKYMPIISSHDPGEADQQSAILVADYGKGHYIYTGLSLFRELPAGVPGAYRVLANLVSYGK